jgi:hypothetical protein
MSSNFESRLNINAVVNRLENDDLLCSKDVDTTATSSFIFTLQSSKFKFPNFSFKYLAYGYDEKLFEIMKDYDAIISVICDL